MRGELVVELSTDSPDIRFAVGAVLSLTSPAGLDRQVTITAARPHTGRLLVTLEGVASRDAAEELRGASFLAAVDDLPPTEDPDEFYDHELEGLTVLTESGDTVGTLREVLHGAGAELLVVDRADGGEALVPFVSQIVTKVDIAAGQVVIDPPAGLLDES